MKLIKEFNEFTHNIEINYKNKKGISKYQRLINKIFRKTQVELYYVSKYIVVLSSIIPVIENFIKNGIYSIEFNEYKITLLTIFAVSLLTNESKDKTSLLYKKLQEENINDNDIEKIKNQLNNIKEIFSVIMKVTGKNDINTFEDMLSNTGIIIPYLDVINSLVVNEKINIDLFSQPFNIIKDTLGESGLKLLIHRILHKLNIITGNTNKFQNKSNIKPLRINDELKGPSSYTEDVVLEKKISK